MSRQETGAAVSGHLFGIDFPNVYAPTVATIGDSGVSTLYYPSRIHPIPFQLIRFAFS
jgi:hypothetical protein